jgi:TonB family protein
MPNMPKPFRDSLLLGWLLALNLITPLPFAAQGVASQIVSKQSVTSAKSNQIPEANKPGTPEEMKWWERLRGAGNEATVALMRRSEAMAKAKNERSVLPAKEQGKLDSAAAATTETYLGLLREGVVNSYRVPIANNRPVILHRVKASYTDDARRKKINGVVVLSIEFRADGRVVNAKVIRGLEGGLNEQAIEAAGQILFLPVVKDGAFISVRGSVEFTFSLY